MLPALALRLRLRVLVFLMILVGMLIQQIGGFAVTVLLELIS